MADDMSIEAVTRRLLRNYRRMLRECEQAIRDADYWNKINPSERPQDPEWFIVQAAGLRKCLAAVKEGRYIEPGWLQSE